MSSGGEAGEATAGTLQALVTAVVLLRMCRVNAALTLQLFSSLFYYINSVCFNKVSLPSEDILGIFFNAIVLLLIAIEKLDILVCAINPFESV